MVDGAGIEMLFFGFRLHNACVLSDATYLSTYIVFIFHPLFSAPPALPCPAPTPAPSTSLSPVYLCFSWLDAVMRARFRLWRGICLQRLLLSFDNKKYF
jgi:hypothetical protein